MKLRHSFASKVTNYPGSDRCVALFPKWLWYNMMSGNAGIFKVEIIFIVINSCMIDAAVVLESDSRLRLMNVDDLTMSRFVQPSYPAVTDGSATTKVRQTYVMRAMRWCVFTPKRPQELHTYPAGRQTNMIVLQNDCSSSRTTSAVLWRKGSIRKYWTEGMVLSVFLWLVTRRVSCYHFSIHFCFI